MRPPILTALAAFATLLVPSAQARMQFLSPPAFDENGSATTRAVRTLGQTLELKWTPAQQGKKLSVVLYQLNATRAASFDGVFHFTEGPFEFITRESTILSLGASRWRSGGEQWRVNRSAVGWRTELT